LHHTKKQLVPGPIAAHSATPTNKKPVVADDDKEGPPLKKMSQLQFQRSACIVKGCRTTVSRYWWSCPDTRVHADARGPPDGNPHRNDFVCDACRDLWPVLKGTFSRMRPTGHINVLPVVPQPVSKSLGTQKSESVPPAQSSPLAVKASAPEGPANIAPLVAAAEASSSTLRLYRCTDCSTVLPGVLPVSCMKTQRAPTHHKCPATGQDCSGTMLPFAPAIVLHDATDFDNLPPGVQFDNDTLPHDDARLFKIRFN
jgi:hypothetical protein